MAYFDECVSISTFDSSDFSASEDPSHISAGSSTAVHDIVPVLQGSLSINLPLHAHDSFSKEKQVFVHPDCPVVVFFFSQDHFFYGCGSLSVMVFEEVFQCNAC